jgi:DNA-binding CsgD family transcriptional regulator
MLSAPVVITYCVRRRPAIKYRRLVLPASVLSVTEAKDLTSVYEFLFATKMDNETTLPPPDSTSIEDYLSARLAWIREGRPLTREFYWLERSLGQLLTGLLDIIADGFSDRDYESAAQVCSAIAPFEGKYIRLIAQELLKQERVFEEEQRPRLNSSGVFRHLVTANISHNKTLKSLKDKVDNAGAEGIESPNLEFFKHMEALVWHRRFFRRYLCSRFGMKRSPLNRLEFQQTRFARENATFSIWLGKRMNADHRFAEGEVDELFSKWNKEQLRERALLRYAQQRLIKSEAKFSIWLIAILISSGHLRAVNDGDSFDLTRLTSDVLKRMEIPLEEFHLISRETELSLAKQLNLSPDHFVVEYALADLTARVISQTSRVVNRGVAEALATDGKPALESLMDRVPADILIALADKAPGERFLPGSGERSVFSRVAGMLAQDLPLEAKHEELRQGRLRKRRTGSESPNSEEESSLRNIPTGAEDLDELPVQDFTLREEARLDISRLANQANLSPREGQVLELQLRGYSEKETGAALKIGKGATSSHRTNAKKKLRKAAGLK